MASINPSRNAPPFTIPASGKQHLFRLLLGLCLLMSVLSLAGHFVADISGGDPLATSVVHTGLALPPAIAIGTVLALVFGPVSAGPIHRSWFAPPQLRPPIPLH